MEIKIKRVYLKLLTKKLLLAMLVVFLMIVSLVGATNAWFYEESSTETHEISAGTVQLGEPLMTNQPNGSDCRVLKWEFDYLGTKNAFIRVRPWINEISGSESLWTEGIKIQSKPQGEGSPASYVYYEKGTGSETDPVEYNLGYGQNYTTAGVMKVWNDIDSIVVEFNTMGYYPMKKSDLYVGLNIPSSPAPGQYGFKHSNAVIVDSFKHRYTINTIYESQNQNPPNIDYSGLKVGEIVYIAGHTDVETATTVENWVIWTPDSLYAGCPTSWLKGNDGWWYTKAEGLNPGSSSSPKVICFEVCEKSGKHMFYLEAEAVQTTHGAIDAVWGTSYPSALLN